MIIVAIPPYHPITRCQPIRTYRPIHQVFDVRPRQTPIGDILEDVIDVVITISRCRSVGLYLLTPNGYRGGGLARCLRLTSPKHNSTHHRYHHPVVARHNGSVHDDRWYFGHTIEFQKSFQLKLGHQSHLYGG